VLTVIDLFENRKKDLGENILIVGAGLIGCETGYHLALKGKSVKVIDILSRDEILADKHDTNRSMLLRNMQKAGVELLPLREIVGVEDDGARIKKADGSEDFISADNIIFASGFLPNSELKGLIPPKPLNVDIYFAGDCIEARKLYEAIHEGFCIGWKI